MVSGARFTRIRVEAVRRLWPNLIEEDKQQMAKSRDGSSTCGAAFADISRRGQINAHAQCLMPGMRRLAAFYLPE
jgi:hypothetical protein